MGRGARLSRSPRPTGQGNGAGAKGAHTTHMGLRRTVSLAFRCMSVFALLGIVAGVGLAAWNLVFALGAEVRPGTFGYYHTARLVTRERDSSGHSRDRVTEESRPVYTYRAADGREVTVHGSAAHAIAYLDPGESIEVLVDPAGEREPIISGFVPLFGDTVAMVLAGGVFLAFAEFLRARVLRWLSAERPAELAGRAAAERPARRGPPPGAASLAAIHGLFRHGTRRRRARCRDRHAAGAGAEVAGQRRRRRGGGECPRSRRDGRACPGLPAREGPRPPVRRPAA